VGSPREDSLLPTEKQRKKIEKESAGEAKEFEMKKNLDKYFHDIKNLNSAQCSYIPNLSFQLTL
jgi:hypothetical protein